MGLDTVLLSILFFVIYITIGRRIAETYIRRYRQDFWEEPENKRSCFYGAWFYKGSSSLGFELNQINVLWFLFFYPFFMMWEWLYRGFLTVYRYFFFIKSNGNQDKF